jgi:hypothetical protein
MALGWGSRTMKMLTGRLPDRGYVSQRAMKCLAMYQADARAFGASRFIRNVRQRLGRPRLAAGEVPTEVVRDMALPPLRRARQESQAWRKDL